MKEVKKAQLFAPLLPITVNESTQCKYGDCIE